MLVRRMLARVEATTGRAWPTAIAGQLDFSERVLYGVFVDGCDGCAGQLVGSFQANLLCLVYWEHTPLNLDCAANFIRSIRPTDIAAVHRVEVSDPADGSQGNFRRPPGLIKYRSQAGSAGRRSLGSHTVA